ncbi:hypothetical protein [Gluconobacter wancherniae]|uniref:hypothetical protein n=1 Tax=Gluconobacter wancherniae TaxID=1307955 RepID=UPI001B8D06D4|nr:hypothetical protein [Gluconobacter wancherniae]MBS1088159.1 hypothetical protein [Gluconobacter wancherniae]
MRAAENSGKQVDFSCTELSPCTTIEAMKNPEIPPETDVWPHCIDTSRQGVGPAIDRNAFCAILRVQQRRDMSVRASQLSAECGGRLPTVDGGSKSCAALKHLLGFMFGENRITIALLVGSQVCLLSGNVGFKQFSRVTGWALISYIAVACVWQFDRHQIRCALQKLGMSGK